MSAQSLDHFDNGRWMMGEVIHHRDTTGLANDFQPTPNPLECLQRLSNGSWVNPYMASNRNGRNGIFHIVVTKHWQLISVSVHFEGSPASLTLANDDSRSRQAVALNGTKGHLQKRLQVGIIPVAQQQAIGWNQSDKMGKRFLHCRQVIENIGAPIFSFPCRQCRKRFPILSD